jgi:two-component system, chemotaxis family, protein-glutamate methylesterase/glutaminase
VSGPRRLRVVVADDSTTARRRLVEALRTDPTIEVVGEATDGEEVLAHCEALKPDVVTLDVTMPGTDGVHATREIMAKTPTPILIVSDLDLQGALVKSAIAAGAVDAFEKSGLDRDDRSFDERFVRAVRLVARIPVVTRPHHRRAPVSAVVEANDPRPTAREIVGIGGSTGGPAAVVELLDGLPADYPLPILLVLHMGPAFGFGFAEWLRGMSPIPVVMMEHGRAPLPGTVHVCPPDRHAVFRGGRMLLTDDAERHSCRPSVDVLFESLSEEAGSSAIGCLLTGIGRDGAEGLSKMQRSGAFTMAQDEASSAVFGMPRQAILLGAAMYIGSPPEIARRLVDAARAGRTQGSATSRGSR